MLPACPPLPDDILTEVGRAAAVRFAKAYPVVLLARRPESYHDIVDEIKQSGGQAIGITADATDEAAVNAAFETIKKELPGSRLAAAIYNVNGGFARKPFFELKREELDASLDAAPSVTPSPGNVLVRDLLMRTAERDSLRSPKRRCPFF